PLFENRPPSCSLLRAAGARWRACCPRSLGLSCREYRMQTIETGQHALRRMFFASIENIFQTELGIADPTLTDYLAELLCRFVRFDAIHGIRDTEGRRLVEVAEMLVEAEYRSGGPRREIYRHIGDFTL